MEIGTIMNAVGFASITKASEKLVYAKLWRRDRSTKAQGFPHFFPHQTDVTKLQALKGTGPMKSEILPFFKHNVRFGQSCSGWQKHTKKGSPC